MNKIYPSAANRPATEWLVLTGGGTDKDLVTERPSYDPPNFDTAKRLPRELVVVRGGDLEYEDINGNSSGVLAVPAGWLPFHLSVQPAKLLGTTTAQVLVLW